MSSGPSNSNGSSGSGLHTAWPASSPSVRLTALTAPARATHPPTCDLAERQLDVLADQSVSEVGSLDRFDPLHLSIGQLHTGGRQKQGNAEVGEEQVERVLANKRCSMLTLQWRGPQ